MEDSSLFDESLFIFVRADGRSRINRRNNDAVNCVLEHDGIGGGSEVVLAGICNDGRTVLVRINCAHNTQIYWDEILQHHFVPQNNVSGVSFSMTIQGRCYHGIFIHERPSLRHPGSQSCQMNALGTVLESTE